MFKESLRELDMGYLFSKPLVVRRYLNIATCVLYCSLENLLELVMLGLLSVLLFARVPTNEEPTSSAAAPAATDPSKDSSDVLEDCQLLR
jgi:hypothetical protein